MYPVQMYLLYPAWGWWSVQAGGYVFCEGLIPPIVWWLAGWAPGTQVIYT